MAKQGKKIGEARIEQDGTYINIYNPFHMPFFRSFRSIAEAKEVYDKAIKAKTVDAVKAIVSSAAGGI